MFFSKKYKFFGIVFLVFFVVNYLYFSNKDNNIRMGNVNGVPVSIPNNYFLFPFEYDDESAWGKRKKTRKNVFDESVESFSLSVFWPSMKPAISMAASDKEKIIISLVNDYDETKNNNENGLSKILRYKINELNNNSVYVWNNSIPEKVNVNYEYQGYIEDINLHQYKPVGVYTSSFEMWNHSYYWKGEEGGYISDLIKCQNGEFINKKTFHKCWHYFEYPEMGAYITITFPLDGISEWQDIKSKSIFLLKSFCN